MEYEWFWECNENNKGGYEFWPREIGKIRKWARVATSIIFLVLFRNEKTITLLSIRPNTRQRPVLRAKAVYTRFYVSETSNTKNYFASSTVFLAMFHRKF